MCYASGGYQVNLPPPQIQSLPPYCGHCSDGPVKLFIGGAGDFFGIFDIGGEIMSNWKPENWYLAMGAGIIGAVVLRKLGLATAEIKAEKNLALGLGDDLFNFAEKNSFHTYRDFSTGFNKSKILDAMKSYDKIHFNTTGFGKIKFSKFDPNAPLTFRNYTNWEMHTIMNDASLLITENNIL